MERSSAPGTSATIRMHSPSSKMSTMGATDSGIGGSDSFDAGRELFRLADVTPRPSLVTYLPVEVRGGMLLILAVVAPRPILPTPSPRPAAASLQASPLRSRMYPSPASLVFYPRCQADVIGRRSRSPVSRRFCQRLRRRPTPWSWQAHYGRQALGAQARVLVRYVSDTWSQQSLPR